MKRIIDLDKLSDELDKDDELSDKEKREIYQSAELELEQIKRDELKYEHRNEEE